MRFVQYSFHLLVIGFGLLMASGTLLMVQTDQRLKSDGIVAQATITAKRHEQGRFERYKLQYTYVPSGQAYQFTATEQTTKAIYEAYTLGDTITIYYLPDRPDITKIEANAPNILPGVVGASICISIGFLDLYKAVRETQRHGQRVGYQTISQASIDYFSRSARERRR